MSRICRRFLNCPLLHPTITRPYHPHPLAYFLIANLPVPHPIPFLNFHSIGQHRGVGGGGSARSPRSPVSDGGAEFADEHLLSKGFQLECQLAHAVSHAQHVSNAIQQRLLRLRCGDLARIYKHNNYYTCIRFDSFNSSAVSD